MAQTVLVIDDSQHIHDLLRVRLGSEGLVLAHALEAEEGLRLARKLLPDLILLDVDMPEMTGFEVCRRLKNEQATAPIPVIFLSAASDVGSKVSGFDAGALDYVTKPFDTAELRARVRSALRTKRYQDLLAERAHVDALTGLSNRGYFDRRMDEEVAAACRYGRTISLLLIDVDHFKKVNDTYGHPFGDRVLLSIAEALMSNSRTNDAPCRYGGEEFAVILTETDAPGARVAAERLREAIARLPFAANGKPVQVTASFGIASSTCLLEVTVEKLIAAADEALYAAKRGGRNCARERVSTTPLPSGRPPSLAPRRAA